jgi:uncharacterized membrane protein YczE
MPHANPVARSSRLDLRAAAPRLPALVIGLLMFGVGIALMVEAGLGLEPWEALNQGIALLPTPPMDPTLVRLAMMAAGVLVIALASGIYLATDLGPGPRDGLMTGAAKRFGWSIRRARTAIELTVLVIGRALGGTVGLGTVVFALGIGPLLQLALGVFDRDGRVGRGRHVELEREGVVGE